MGLTRHTSSNQWQMCLTDRPQSQFLAERWTVIPDLDSNCIYGGFLWLTVSKINRRSIGFVQNVFWFNGISLALYPVYQHPVLSTISRSARIQWWDVGLPRRWTEGNSQLRFRQKSLEESWSRTIIWYDIQYSWTGASKLIKTLMWSKQINTIHLVLNT